MHHSYSIYGLHLRADHALPSLTPNATDSQADVEVWMYDLPAWATRAISGTRTTRFDSGDAAGASPATVRVWRFAESGAFQFAYGDGVGFVVDARGRRIAVTCAGTATLADAASYLVGVILGFVLRLRRRMALHASVVAVDERAIAILGNAGSGKSTTAATFASMGHRVLADDVCVPVEHADGFRVEPGYPGIRLRPDAVQEIFGSETALPRVSPSWDKRLLELASETYRFQPRSLPIGGLYWLRQARSPESTNRIRRLVASERMIRLVTVSYPRYLLDADMKADEFDTLAKIASCIPGAEIEVRPSLDSVTELCQSIVEDYRAGAGELRCG